MHFTATFDACKLATAQTVTASEVPVKGNSVLLIRLLTVISTYVQSLKPSFQGSTKLGLVETQAGSNHSLRYRLADSLFQRFSGFLT
jgi:hypothetical protein